MSKSFVLILAICSLPLRAQTPYLVRDINTTRSGSTKSSFPSDFAAYKNRVFFAATTDATGTELWSTDGSSDGTSLVADIIPGAASSNPSGLIAVGGALLFSARDVNHGIELWTTDGTSAGTHLLLDINPGPNSAQPFSMTTYKTRILFSADDGTNGREPWISDGTAAGTHLLKDLNPGAGSSSPAFFTTLGDSAFFAAVGGLWKTDGTAEGTVNIAAVGVRSLTAAGGSLFFEGFDAATGWELWVSDGTETGTHIVSDILPGPHGALDNFQTQLSPFGNRVLFLASDGVHGREMWVSDGTEAGTRMVRDFVPGATGMWDSSSTSIATLGDRAFFAASDDQHGIELWVTDGTDAGTSLFADLTPGPASSSPFSFAVAGGKLFFAAGGDVRLWVTDGTSAGTRIIGDAVALTLSFSSSITFWPVNGQIYFAGGTPLTGGGEPWVSDGTDAGSHIIADLAADQAPSSWPAFLTATDGLLFFYAIEGTLSPSTNVAESSLWRSDGTAAGTFKLREAGQHPAPLTAAGPYVFFGDQVNNSASMSDGTVAGTKPSTDFLQRFGGSRVGDFFAFGDTLFTNVYDIGVYDSSLWKTTAAANAPAIRLGSRNAFGLIDVAGQKMFYAEGPQELYDYSIWTTDGTPAGTHAIVGDLGGTNAQPLSSLVNAAGTVFFLKQVRDETLRLWKSDGTFDGTTVVKDLGLPSTTYSEMKAAGRRVFFLVGDSLWTSDGSAAGTVALMKVRFPVAAGNVDELFAAGNHIVFALYSDTGVLELWSSDGTAAGTKLLVNLTGSYQPLVSIDGIVYFAGTDDQHGTELWSTDGTSEGTKLLADINVGPNSSSPTAFTKVGNTLYFRAYTDATGGELWALPLDEPRLSIADARVTEGDTTTAILRFVVSLSTPAKQDVTVRYDTSDGTATAGTDYDASSGTITFAAGETSRTIDVTVHGDVSPENNETIFVTLHDAAGARIVKAEAFGIIDDDDQFVDLSVTPSLSSYFTEVYDAVLVSNNGPRSATDVTVQITSAPDLYRSDCSTCFIAQVPVGGSVTTSPNDWPPSQQSYLSAIVTARQRDVQPSNNSVTWTINQQRSMVMTPAYLRLGEKATVTAVLPITPTSTDPSVAVVSSDVTQVGNNIGSFTVTALKPGTTTIAVDGLRYPLVLTVPAAGTSMRWPGGVSISVDFGATRFEKPVTVTISPDATAPGSGAKATGTLSVTVNGQRLAQQTISGATLTFPLYLPSIGQLQYQFDYSGDVNFLPQTSTGTVFVQKGEATLDAELHAVDGAPIGTYSLTTHAIGSPVAFPTGTLSVRNGAVEIALMTLAASGAGTSVAQATLTNLAQSATLTINYSGDAIYNSGSQQVRPPALHRRAVHH